MYSLHPSTSVISCKVLYVGFALHAELGEVVNGDKSGREGNEIIVVDLTGTGAQDAAIGQVAWDKLSKL